MTSSISRFRKRGTSMVKYTIHLNKIYNRNIRGVKSITC